MRAHLDRGGVDREIAALASTQRGLITRPQLFALGLSRSAIGRRLTSGRLHRVHAGVYSVGHPPLTRAARWLAAVLACGEGAVLGIRSASAHWRMHDGEGRFPDVIVPGRGGRGHPAIRVHRMRLHPDDRTAHKGIRVTTPERTLIDLAAALDERQLARALREAQYLQQFDARAMQAALARKPCRAVAALVADLVATESPLEDLLLVIIDRYRLPRPEMQYRILGHRLDFVWPAAKVVVETDGWESHSTRRSFQADRTLSNRLQLAGWTILRFTYADVNRRPEEVADAIRVALSRGGRDEPA